jgi:predicted ThiF/HesA family dinucleotide-utilizing enzyme
MQETRSFIVRVYARTARGRLRGTVEVVGSGERLGFNSAEQLWVIVSRGGARIVNKRPRLK